MRLTNILTKEVTVLRLSDVGGNKMEFSTVTGTLRCDIQPIANENEGLSEGVYGKRFVAYSDGSISLYSGDVLKDDDGNLYTVKSGGVTTRQHNRITYQKVIIESTE